MNYIVLDLEWNQSANGKTNEKIDIPFEILEIGAVKVNSDFEITDRFCETIKPKVYKQLHYKIQEITRFTYEELNKGKSFTQVMSMFLDWCAKDGSEYRFCTWGAMDITELQRNMKHYNMPLFKFPVLFYDLQKIYSFAYEDRHTRRSLEFAVDSLGIQKDIPFHRALSDAVYTAKVMKKLHETKPHILSQYYSVDYFQKPQTKSEQINIVYDDYSKFVSREFSNRENILKDRDISSSICYKCGKKASRKIRWFSDGGRNYYSMSLCPEHGYLKGKIRIKKSDHDKIFVVKTMKLTDENGFYEMKKRQNDLRLKRRQKRNKEKHT